MNIEDNIAPVITKTADPQFIFCGMEAANGPGAIDLNKLRIKGLEAFDYFANCGATEKLGPWSKVDVDCKEGPSVRPDIKCRVKMEKDEQDGWRLERGIYKGFRVLAKYVRTYSVTDDNDPAHGSGVRTAEQVVYVLQPRPNKIKNARVECVGGMNEDLSPAALSAIDARFAPSYTIYDANTNKGCKPMYMPIPLDHAGCGFAITYSDSEKIKTDCGYKVFRTYTWTNWCKFGMYTEGQQYIQIIEVTDRKDPVLACKSGAGSSADNPLVFSTNSISPFECAARVNLATPQATDDCDENPTTYLIGIFAASDTKAQRPLPLNLAKIVLEKGCKDSYFAMYGARDACGNDTNVKEEDDDADKLETIRNCRIYFDVVDDVNPVAIADEYTVVPVTEANHGAVTICADNIDSGSYDNCSDLTLELSKKQAGVYTNCITLSCDDLFSKEDDNAHDNECPGTVNIFFRATDECGNFDIAMVEVELQDKVKPTIVAPRDKHIDCKEKDPYSFFGTPVYSDNCDKNPKISHRDSGSIDECGNGSITRTWQVEDACGNKASASQTITSKHVSDFVVTFPADINGECTGNNFDFDASDVKLEGVDCENILIHHEDKVFYGVEDACYKIIRTIEVINWCVNDGTTVPANDDTRVGTRKYQDGGNGYIKWVQTIKVKDTEDPYVTEGPAKLRFEDKTDDCGGPWHIEIAADDKCTGAENLDISWRVLGTGQQGSGTDAAGVLDYGSYTIIYWIKDGCGNTIEAEYDFEIVDAKNPNLVCVGYLTSDLMPIDTDGDHTVDGGMSEVWASEFVKSYEDNCKDCEGDDCYLIEDVSDAYYSDAGYSADKPGADAAKGLSFTCDDYKAEYLRAIAVWAKDAAGNWTYCVAFFELQNNMGACGDAKASIAVAITTEKNQEVEGAKIELTGMDMVPAFTNRQGAASFLAPKGGDYTVVPQKNIDALNGVSTLDIVLMTQHILGTKEFTSPYQLIAADVNKSGSLTASDMVQIRQLILNVTSEFPNNSSWRFVDKSFEFANAANPWATPFPEVVSISGLTTDAAADFIGVKIGDVNGNAIGAQPRNAVGTLTFKAADAKIAAGQEYTVDFTSADLANVAGYQFTMAFDQSNLEFVDVKAGALAGLTEGNFGLTKLDEGVITTSYNANELAANDEVLFSITFRAKSDVQLSNAVSINSRYTAAEGYDANLSTLDVAIEFGNTVVAEGFELFQNAPNPFQTETRIGFNLSEAGAATMTIMDISGKVLKVIDGEYAKGYNEVTLNRAELSGAGVLYYQLNTANDSATKKMILVE